MFYRVLDFFSGLLIVASVLFAPWAFGTVHDWSINVLNGLCFVLGVCWLIKLGLRRRQGLDGWEGADLRQGSSDDTKERNLGAWRPKWFTAGVGCSLAIIVYVVLHVLNARAIFDSSTLIMTYIDGGVSWLPRSYDRAKSVEILLQYSALLLFFWATRDWLLDHGRAPKAQVSSEANSAERGLPRRLKFLMIVIGVNGALLGFEGLLQRLSGTEDLLWIYHPKFQSWDIWTHFGPFGYRGNAASYLNLVWPVGLFFVALQAREARYRDGGRRIGQSSLLVLLPIFAFSVISPLITTSRAGAAVFLFQLAVASALFFRFSARRKKVAGALIAIIIMAFFVIDGLSSRQIIRRFAETSLSSGADSGRLNIYRHFGGLLRDNWLWGAGPGAFSTVYFVYRRPTLEVDELNHLGGWAAWAHSDPVEFLISFGVVGSLILLFSLFALLFPVLKAGRERRIKPPDLLLVLPITGVFVHGLVDFPFQVYSVQHLFTLVLCLAVVVGEVRCLEPRQL